MRTKIAETTILIRSPDGKTKPIHIAVGRPYRITDTEAACPISMRGLYPKLPDLHGGDTFQALAIALQFVRTNLWKVPKEYHYFYGKIPYPVEDVDPSLSSYWDKNGNLLVGVRLGARFYAMKNLGQVQKNAAAIKVIKIHRPLGIVEIKLPQHRASELDVFLKQREQ